MKRLAVVVGIAGFLAGVIAVPTVLAQQTSSISGVVKDSSGAVLPGVTVEAASPALIEKVRTATSDGEGRFNIVDLVPGTYTVTFTLTGFSASSVKASRLPPVHREGQRRSARRRARGNHHGQRRRAARRHAERAEAAHRRAELFSTLPTSTKQIYTLVTLTPGFAGVADVGGRYTGRGGRLPRQARHQGVVRRHGLENSSGNSSYQINAAAVEGDGAADQRHLGRSQRRRAGDEHRAERGRQHVQGDRQRASTPTTRWRADNLNDDLRARGLNAANKTVQDFRRGRQPRRADQERQVWFFGAPRTWGMAQGSSPASTGTRRRTYC